MESDSNLKKGRSKECSYPDQPGVAVGAVVFKDNCVLLVKRGKPPACGEWAIPGGSVMLGETIRDAVKREIMEETGIVVRPMETVFTFDLIEHDDEGRVCFHYVIVDFVADYISGEPRPGDDAVDARWVSPFEMNDLDVNTTTRKMLMQRFGFGIDSDCRWFTFGKQ